MKKLVLIAAFFFLIACLPADAARTVPESREYKILLKAENFTSFTKGCELFWELVESVALDQGVKVKKAEKTYPDREICFIDTPDFALYKKGFMLRLRSEEASRANQARTVSETEMTLKFRASDFESTVIAPVKASENFSNEISFEEDRIIKASEPISVFSVSSNVFKPEKTPANLDEFLKFYPNMTKAGFHGNAALKPVNGIYITEKRLRLGEFKFDKLKAKSVFSVWYKKGQTAPFIGEFSFKVYFELKKPAENIRNLEKIDRFFRDLVKRGKLFVAFGQTKTGMIYQQRRK
ncbi:MAG: hypothetical protein ACOYXC_19870 [Candidatus Rifleibacteriota bacterium]